MMTAKAWAARTLVIFSRRWFEALICLILCLAVLATFRSVPRFEFVMWDDDHEVYQNQHIQGLDWPRVKWMFTNRDYVGRYKPLGWLCWAMVHELCGLNASAYHWLNLILHMACACLVFFLIRRILKTWHGEKPEDHGPALSASAALGGLWWAIHPLRAEPVSWVSAGTHLQSALFLWICFLAYLRASDGQCGTATRSRWHWLSVLAYAMSLLSFPVWTTAPLILIVLDIFLLRRFCPVGAFRLWDGHARRVWLEKAPFFVAAIAAGLWLLSSNPGAGLGTPTLAEFPVMSRISRALYVWGYYLWIHWWPFDLSVIYTQLTTFRPTGAAFHLTAYLTILISCLLFAWRRRVGALFAAWLCHLLILGPLLGVTTALHYTTDRYAYVQGAIWAVLISGALYGMWQRAKFRIFCLIAAAMTLLGVLHGFLTFRQSLIWKDTSTLFSFMIMKLGAHPYRADIYWRFGRYWKEKGQLATAIEWFDKALEITPDDLRVFSLKAEAQMGLGDFKSAANTLRRALSGQYHLRLQQQLGHALLKQGLLEEARAQFEDSIRRCPTCAEAHVWLAKVAIQEKNLQQAAARLSKALELNPNHAEARALLNHLLAVSANDPDSALTP